jgi:uncharacterized protein (UPF0333 family)
MVALIIKKLLGLIAVIAIIIFGYNYIKNHGSDQPGSPIQKSHDSSGAINNAKNAVQQSQNYQNRLNSAAGQYNQ